MADASPHAYDLALARSTDGGRTWRDLGLANDDATATEHGFVSMAAEGDGLRLMWLDGRELPQGGGTQVRSARLDDTLGPSEVVDGFACDCCGTQLVVTSRGPVAIFRDRTDTEVRDIAWAVRTAAGWSAAAPVARDGWQMPGCPVNGPRAAMVGEQLLAAWTTGAGGEVRVKAAWSPGAGEPFGPEIPIGAPSDATSVIGRVDVVALPSGDAVVSWVQSGDDAGLWLRRVSPEGAVGAAIRLGQAGAGHRSGFPRLAVHGDELLVAWTDPDGAGGLAGARLDLAELPPSTAAPGLPTGSVQAEVVPPLASMPRDLELQDLQGRTTMLRPEPAGATLVHLWASWCAPCMTEMPRLRDLAAADPTLSLIMIAVEDSPERVQALVSEGGIPGRVLLSSATDVQAAFHQSLVPSSFLFDADGLLLWRHNGALPGPADALDALLQDAGASPP